MGCLRREIADETGVVLESIGAPIGTCTELNPGRDGVSTWTLECRYLLATTSGDRVPATPSGYEIDIGLHPLWASVIRAKRSRS